MGKDGVGRLAERRCTPTRGVMVMAGEAAAARSSEAAEPRRSRTLAHSPPPSTAAPERETAMYGSTAQVKGSCRQCMSMKSEREKRRRGE